jgi:hypothetical protein
VYGMGGGASTCVAVVTFDPSSCADFMVCLMLCVSIQGVVGAVAKIFYEFFCFVFGFLFFVFHEKQSVTHDFRIEPSSIFIYFSSPGRYTVAVPLPERAVDISAGSAHFACVSDTGMAYLWGRNGSGQCGGGAGAGWAGLAVAADDDAVDADDVEPGVMPGTSDGASRDSGDHSGPDRGEAMVASDNVTDTVPANPDTAAKVAIPRSSIAAFPREYRGMTPLFVKSRTGSARAGTQGYDRLAFADAESLARARNGIRGTNAKDAPPLPGTVTRFARIAAGPAHTLLLAGSGAVYAVGGAGGSVKLA